AMPRGRHRGLRAAGREVPPARVAPRLQRLARSGGGLGCRPGGVRAGVASAAEFPRPVGVLYMALSDRDERGVRPGARSRCAGAGGAGGRAFGTERIPEEDWDRVLVDQPVAARPDAAAAGAQQRARIERALSTLSPDHRRIVVLSDIEGLSYREIADVLEIP